MLTYEQVRSIVALSLRLSWQHVTESIQNEEFPLTHGGMTYLREFQQFFPEQDFEKNNYEAALVLYRKTYEATVATLMSSHIEGRGISFENLLTEELLANLSSVEAQEVSGTPR